MKINKITNYKALAMRIESHLECDVKINILNKEHFHFHVVNKNGIHLGIICYSKGDLSFAPFTKEDNHGNHEDRYIGFLNAPMFEEIGEVFKLLPTLVDIFDTETETKK